MKKLWGNISYVFARFIDLVLTGTVTIFEYVTSIGDSLLKFIMPIIALIVIGVVAFPPLLLLIFTGFGISLILIIMFAFIIPILGRGALNYLHMAKYVWTNYFYSYAKYYKGESNKYNNFSYYSNKYKEELNRKFEEERMRAEEARRKRQEAENERWRRFFEENFNQYRTYGGYQGGYQQSSSNQYNPFGSFKQQYEQSCDVLNVPYSSSFSEIKSAYRKLAKKYHPDLSKERNAEEMFKKVNNAFDFLSEENVKRYQQL